jgi:hypothetical protein
MKFSIRDLFLVTVIVALATGWALDHWRLSRFNHSIQEMWTITLDRESRLLEVLDGRMHDLEALESRLDENDPGWRYPSNGEDRGYGVMPGKKIERVPPSQSPARNPPKP